MAGNSNAKNTLKAGIKTDFVTAEIYIAIKWDVYFVCLIS